MSLSAREQQTLDSIETELAASDPKLASLMATFARLTSGEDMPVRERIWAVSRRGTLGAGRLRRHLGFLRAAAWLWLVVAVMLVAVMLVAVALATSSGSRATCAKPWPAACAAPAPGGSSSSSASSGHETAVNPAARSPG